MQINLFITLFLVPCIIADQPKNTRKIKLEDIEHDNLLSERRLESKDPLEKQQTQYARPLGIQSISQYKSSPTLPSRGGVIYASESTQEENQSKNQQQKEYAHNDAAKQLERSEYVNSANVIQEVQHPAQVYGPPDVHEPSHTYSVPSRETLVKPIVPTLAPYVHQQEQPQYVYVQTRNQLPLIHDTRNLKHVAGDIEYDGEQPLDGAFTYSHDDGLPASDHKQQSEEVAYQQQQQQQQQHHHHHHPGSVNYLQYVPYITRGPTDEQSYVMMVPNPAGYQQQNLRHVSINPSVVTYSHSTGPSAEVPYQSAGVQYISPQASVQYIGNKHQDVQYADPNEIDDNYRQSIDKSKQYLYAPKHPEPQEQSSRQQQLPKLDYSLAQKVIPLNQQQQQQPHVYSTPQTVQAIRVPSILASQAIEPPQQAMQPYYRIQSSPGVDYFYGRDSRSLLDSYIPSWVIIKRQRSLQQNYATPVLDGYNTISYAIPHPPSPYSSGYVRKGL